MEKIPTVVTFSAMKSERDNVMGICHGYIIIMIIGHYCFPIGIIIKLKHIPSVNFTWDFGTLRIKSYETFQNFVINFDNNNIQAI